MNLKEYKNFFKNKNNRLFSVILIIGVILIFISGTNDNDKDTDSKKAFSEEERLEEILSDIQGTGRVSVMITYYETKEGLYSEKNKAKGAVITADGCRDPSIKSALSAAACAALDLPAHKVCVYLKK